MNFPKAFVFDVDGTLLNSEPYQIIARKRIYARLGMPENSEDELVIGTSKQKYWADFKKRYGLTQSLEELIDTELVEIIEEIKRNGLPPATGLKALLAFLRENGVKIGIASASNLSYVKAVIEHLGVSEYFTAFCGGDDKVQPKPSPEPYLLVCERLGVQPQDAVGVEDSRLGTMAVSAAGLFCIGYRETEMAKNADLSASNMTVDTMTEILEWLKTEF